MGPAPGLAAVASESTSIGEARARGACELMRTRAHVTRATVYYVEATAVTVSVTPSPPRWCARVQLLIWQSPPHRGPSPWTAPSTQQSPVLFRERLSPHKPLIEGDDLAPEQLVQLFERERVGLARTRSVPRRRGRGRAAC
jgi:hypothetical protein